MRTVSYLESCRQRFRRYWRTGRRY